ncbi:hypothetical protein FB566_2263 [Stackebrandtia endophytica]|uniref:Uncharacterized protein n=1 Tax=Stackebrandtia endophytica TaxID=1496996 RepID=A0A543AVX0_9ACTN|nr:hypothetical protein [Stackebrandtia endophytica]TQL76727.1 hypothetical protein FB566_2263 [Stackebrandtia endophytica]
MSSSESRDRLITMSMTIVSMIYAGILGVMAAMSWPGVAAVAIGGGCLVGIGWVVVAVMTDRFPGKRSAK